MAASVVHDGAGVGGTLFARMKFFIAQRVPLRQTWVEGIKSNGGSIVQLEKQADMVR